MGGQTLEEVETEAEKETDQISVGTEEGSGAEEDHIGGFHLARAQRTHANQTDVKSSRLHCLQIQAFFL